MRRALTAAVIVVLALALSWVHWLGLFAGGVALGLLARSWPRALGAGAAFGALAWVVFLVALADAGRLAGYFASGRLLYVSVAVPLALGVLGALSHGLRRAGSTA